jgi:hypothetical protein
LDANHQALKKAQMVLVETEGLQRELGHPMHGHSLVLLATTYRDWSMAVGGIFRTPALRPPAQLPGTVDRSPGGTRRALYEK